MAERILIDFLNDKTIIWYKINFLIRRLKLIVPTMKALTRVGLNAIWSIKVKMIVPEMTNFVREGVVFFNIQTKMKVYKWYELL